MTEQAYLRHLLATHNKFTSMAFEVGCSHVAIIRAMQKYGMTKPRSTAFEYDGQLVKVRFWRSLQNTRQMITSE